MARSRTSPRPAASSTPVRNRSASPCSTTIRTAGRICSWPTTRSPTSSTAICATALSRRSPSRPESLSAPTARRAPAWASTSADFENSGTPGIAITNFDNEMIGLYRAAGRGSLRRCRDHGRDRLAVTEHARIRMRFPRRRSRRSSRSRRRQRSHRRDRAQHPRQRGLRAAAASFSERRQRQVSRRRVGAGKRLRSAARSAAAWPTPTSIATAISIC